MSTHRHIEKICAVIIVCTVLLTVLFMNGEAFGLVRADRVIGYETRIFDNSKVHTIAIVMDDWDGFLETCENEEYALCSVVIDGESVKNVGIRAKGNTSLSSVKQAGNNRYSFKIEFDQYETGRTYHGLDKLSLNNVIQDNTYMKDYLAYTLMGQFGVDSPLCSYVWITVNGEDWGLYLAVEGVEDSFLSRNYGGDTGDLYKPDSMSFGGGRGNGKDFDMDALLKEFDGEQTDTGTSEAGTDSSESSAGENQSSFPSMPGGMSFPGGDFSGGFPSFGGGGGGGMPDMSSMPDMGDFDAENFDPSSIAGGPGGFGGGGFGMGSDDVKLQYTDDDPSSYSAIFDSAKTTVTKADKARLIEALKTLSGDHPEDALVTDEVLRYFVVHSFLVNGDSYTGSIVHNYYLHEKDGKLSMIPWDYNLAFGTFSGGNASSSVNSPIDTPVSGGMSDRPMVAWIFKSEEYTAEYHTLFAEFLETFDFAAMIDETAALIRPYIEKDPTAFCTAEEFETAVETMKSFCSLREESVQGQLDGSIPSTQASQSADSSALIDTTGINLSDMGSMGGGAGGGGFGGFGGDRGDSFSRTGRSRDAASTDSDSDEPEEAPPDSGRTMPSAQPSASAASGESGNENAAGSRGNTPPSDFGGGNIPGGFGGGNLAEGFSSGEVPEGFDAGSFPEGFDAGNMPEGFDPSSLPSSGQQVPSDSGEEGGSSGESSGRTGRPGSGQFGRGGEGGFSFSGENFPGGTPNGTPGSSSGGETENTVILLAVSGILLIASILVAWKYKR